jgi:hypothetical protein
VCLNSSWQLVPLWLQRKWVWKILSVLNCNTCLYMRPSPSRSQQSLITSLMVNITIYIIYLFLLSSVHQLMQWAIWCTAEISRLKITSDQKLDNQGVCRYAITRQFALNSSGSATHLLINNVNFGSFHILQEIQIWIWVHVSHNLIELSESNDEYLTAQWAVFDMLHEVCAMSQQI